MRTSELSAWGRPLSHDPTCRLAMYGNLPYNWRQEDDPMAAHSTTARLEARISADLHAQLKRDHRRAHREAETCQGTQG